MENGEKDLTHCNFLPTAVFDTKEKGLTKLSPQNGRMKTEVGVGGGGWRPRDSQKSLWKGEEPLVLRNLSSKGASGFGNAVLWPWTRGMGGKRSGLWLGFDKRGCTGIPTQPQLPSLPEYSFTEHISTDDSPRTRHYSRFRM